MCADSNTVFRRVEEPSRQNAKKVDRLTVVEINRHPTRRRSFKIQSQVSSDESIQWNVEIGQETLCVTPSALQSQYLRSCFSR